MRVTMTTTAAILLLFTLGCSALLGQPERSPLCYHDVSGSRRCFASERELSADIALREQLAVERASEERAKQMALAIVAERDAKEAAELARRTVERADRVQDDAFEVLVEIHEDAAARERAAELPR